MPYQPFGGLQAPQGLQVNWQPNVGGEGGGGDSGQAMQGLGSAADMLQQWLAMRRKKGGVGSAMAGEIMQPMSQTTDLPMQKPQNIA